MTDPTTYNDKPVLKVRDLSIAYETGKYAVKVINADIESKAITAIMGPSGCGKSTLLRAFNKMHELISEHYHRRVNLSE